MSGLSNSMFLLADAGTVITVLVIFFSFISWVVQKISENKNVPPPKGRPAQKLPAPQAKELDEFLKRARRQGNQAGRQNDDLLLDHDLLEVVEDEPRRRPRPVQVQTPREQKRPKAQAGTRPQPLGAPLHSQPRLDDPIISRQPPNRPRQSANTASVGHNSLSQMQEHVIGYMETGRIDKEVTDHLPHLEERRNQTGSTIDWSTGSEKENATGTLIEDTNAARISIIDMFHHPQQVRQAIIVNEILQRPRSLRKD